VTVVDTTFYEQEKELPEEFRAHLAGVQRVFEIEFARGSGLTDDEWGMLTVLEAFIASERDGIIFSNEDGIYDRDVQLRVSLGRFK
jgi:hypothetical protein